MVKLKSQHIQALAPYLVGEAPKANGEWDMFCPQHDDENRSASVNVNTAMWYCNACDVGGNIIDVIRHQRLDELAAIGGVHSNGVSASSNSAALPSATPAATAAQVAHWVTALAAEGKTAALTAKRGISLATLKNYDIGWDASSNAYTIPVYDADGGVANVRRYQITPKEGRRKIWSVTGHGSSALYPIDQLDYDTLVICEGEWDALATIDMGIPAITKTGGAKNWNPAWNSLFANKEVYICHDADTIGTAANNKIRTYLTGIAKSVTIVHLPYAIEDDHGKDLTDFWADGNTAADFWALVDPVAVPVIVEDIDINVLDSFNSDHYGRLLGMRVTITGKSSDGYIVPKNVDYNCTLDAGKKCSGCSMLSKEGVHSQAINKEDPVVLKLMDTNESQRNDTLRELAQIVKCDKLRIDFEDVHSIERLNVRTSVDTTQNGHASHVGRQVVSVGRHDTMPNTTVQMLGRIHPDPKDQRNVYMAHRVDKTDTSIDNFAMDAAMAERLQVFQIEPGQRPIAKAAAISKDLCSNVTKIYGRGEMHVLFDLVFHSVLEWNFDGALQRRGWLEALIVGDTRTGKSEIAARLCDHYKVGEIISCETASFAGVVGGLQQVGNKEWEITWGAVPLNDRRMVIMDEVSGLTTDQIAQMSSIRSSGIAELTKIRTERTSARTRLLWMGNPRHARMADFTFATHALRPLIGNNEDIARFDFAMAVSAGEVSSDEINMHRNQPEGSVYTQQACNDLILWAWSRTADQVVWEPDATSNVYSAAVVLGKQYTEDPPLIQAANVRTKLARIAVALAARTFSIDIDPEVIVVRKHHVTDAVWFLNKLYDMGNFGYKYQSDEYYQDQAAAVKNSKKAEKILRDYTGLDKFLRGCYGTFRVNDLQDMLAVSREEASVLINDLWELRMVERRGGHIKILPILHGIIRKINTHGK